MEISLLIYYNIVLVLACIVMGDVSDLKIGCWNCRGLRSSVPYIRELLEGHDVLAISEHWLHNNKLNVLSDLSTTHSVHARASRQSADEYYGARRGQGGVAIFWRKDIPGFSAITDVTHDRICAVRYQNQKGGVYIFLSIYMPSQGSIDSLEECLEDLTEILETRERGAILVVCGDYNGDIGDHGNSRSRKTPTVQGTLVIAFLNRHGLYAVNMDPMTFGPIHTCEGPGFISTLDYVAIPVEMIPKVSSSRGLQEHCLNTSDHMALSIVLRVEGVKIAQVQNDSQGRVRWDKMTKADVKRKYKSPLQTKFFEHPKSFTKGGGERRVNR